MDGRLIETPIPINPFLQYFSPPDALVYLITGTGEQCESIRYDPEQTSGLIRSLDVDGDGIYEQDLDCTWSIESPPDKVVKLDITDFELEPDDFCRYDSLEVHDTLDQSELSLLIPWNKTLDVHIRSTLIT